MSDYAIGCGIRMPVSFDARGYVREGVPHLLEPYERPSGSFSWDELPTARTLCGRTIRVGSTYFASTWPALYGSRCTRCAAVADKAGQS